MQALTNSRIRPYLLSPPTLAEFPELGPAAAALRTATSMPGGSCCGSSPAQKEVDALALAMQTFSVMPLTRLVSFLRLAGFRGPVKVYRKVGDRKERSIIDSGP